MIPQRGHKDVPKISDSLTMPIKMLCDKLDTAELSGPFALTLLVEGSSLTGTELAVGIAHEGPGTECLHGHVRGMLWSGSVFCNAAHWDHFSFLGWSNLHQRPSWVWAVPGYGRHIASPRSPCTMHAHTVCTEIDLGLILLCLHVLAKPTSLQGPGVCLCFPVGEKFAVRAYLY